jgi:hypothetical protein
MSNAGKTEKIMKAKNAEIAAFTIADIANINNVLKIKGVGGPLAEQRTKLETRLEELKAEAKIAASAANASVLPLSPPGGNSSTAPPASSKSVSVTSLRKATANNEKAGAPKDSTIFAALGGRRKRTRRTKRTKRSKRTRRHRSRRHR